MCGRPPTLVLPTNDVHEQKKQRSSTGSSSIGLPKVASVLVTSSIAPSSF
jgi:hypothetical protein